jgi:hypothetical protein
LTRCVLFRDYDGTTYELETPLTSNIEYAQVATDLGIPEYVNKSNFHIERGLVTIWAGLNAHRMGERLPAGSSVKLPREPIPVLFFGGAAVRMLCPSTNEPSSPLYRELNDIDLISSKSRAQDLYRLLLALGDVCGTRYHYFVSRSDRRFNAMRAGKRYRVRTVERVLDDGTIQCGLLDIFTDSIDLRHRVDVRDAFGSPKDNLYTVGLHNIILSKCQYIFDAPVTAREELIRQQLDYRILSYPYYRADRILIGIEEKDMRDLCAIFLDHEIGEERNEISLDKIHRTLDKDKKFALTLRLNLESMLRNEGTLKGMGVPSSDITKVFGRIEEILAALPKVDKRWSNPWWNVDVETPQIFGKSPTV